jgi:Zn-dependent protease with chaperone function
MSFLLLLATVSLATFGVVCLAATALCELLVSRRRRVAILDPIRPLALRLLPAITGGAAAVLTLVAFLAYEPWTAGAPPLWLLTLSGLGLALVLRGAVGLARARLASRSLSFPGQTRFEAPGCPLPATLTAHPFPVVALVGVRAPRVVLARRVAETLEPTELSAVIGHELAHWRRRDNLTALLLRGLPDVFGLLPAGRRLETEWSEAAERAADRSAAESAPGMGLDLASALVKVARLVPAGQQIGAQVAAFHTGAPIAGRVEALLAHQGAAPASSPAVRAWPALVAGLPIVALLSPGALRAIHLGLESLIHLLR